MLIVLNEYLNILLFGMAITKQNLRNPLRMHMYDWKKCSHTDLCSFRFCPGVIVVFEVVNSLKGRCQSKINPVITTNST